jgi:hypothetical protein
MVRTVFTTITPLPSNITRETVLATLHDHLEMIDLNPSHEERHMVKPPPEASPEEYHCQWYAIIDKISYLPAGMYKGKVSFKACFHDLSTGLQTHVYAPMGIDIKEKWTLGGNLPHEPRGCGTEVQLRDDPFRAEDPQGQSGNTRQASGGQVAAAGGGREQPETHV